jgi:FKBP-type peptidyl-prolyl cis-trans isomerase
MRRAAALVFFLLLAAAAVAGCSSSSSSTAASTSSAAYNQVTVTGAFNKAPTVKIPAAKGAGSLYTKTLIQGTGATVNSSEGIVANYVAYDWSGAKSTQLGSSYTSKIPSIFVGQLLTGLEKSLYGQKLGSRVLAVIPPADAFGSTGNSTEGIKATDTLVFVVDMISKFETTPVSGTQAATGNSAVSVGKTTAATTTGPAVTINSKATPPTKLQVTTLIKGTGAKVVKGDDVAVQYTGLIWRTGKVFQSSWSAKSPFTTEIGAGQVIPGWDTGLVGQTVGSRVLLVIPPADGYGTSGQSSVGITGKDTLVFVIDILAAVG